MAVRNDKDLRDARRAHYLGKAWHVVWVKEGRGTSGDAGGWIENFREREKEIYVWVWERPALSEDVDEELDKYRAQQTGATFFELFAGHIYAASITWFERAREQARAQGEGWLFSDESLRIDGWIQGSGMTKAGQEVTGWTKS